ncbi:hypothetical protein HS088_TW22G00782 [Tripterygium wilfordii]|uniref:Pentatricopeptide repeat-containing protein n=1 Tax=Tripterygium wilfordii TaxID=458696 RepID=A0A7J7BZI6_TRIWF|nr:pentatricopeptide repeat-containing protein At4g38150 [Tripterygium wilfordii]KAF5727095.1 hypothetical protein HS088_TW22G00782 [Tripterygium wilfordii]
MPRIMLTGAWKKLLPHHCHPSSPIITSKIRRFSSLDAGDDSYGTPVTPPDPIPNRPLRAERPFRRHSASEKPNTSRPQPPTSDRQVQIPQTSNFPRNRDEQESDRSFLEKFKLANPQAQPPPRSRQKHHQQEQQEPPEEAAEIFKKMKETGLIPNAVAMLDGLCKDGLVQEAMKLFGLIREKGTIPEVVIYTAVVEGFCKAHKLDDAKRIFRKMQNNGITPNAFSYSVLIQGLYKCNCLDDAVQFCLEMIEAGNSPNVTTFVGLVDGLCREKGVEEAQRVIETLRGKGFFVNDKHVREFLDKNAPFSNTVREAIFGKKTSRKPF